MEFKELAIPISNLGYRKSQLRNHNMLSASMTSTTDAWGSVEHTKTNRTKQKLITMSQTGSKSKRSCEASFSSSFEVYAAIGGDPDLSQVDKLFIAASKNVLNIKSEGNRTISHTNRRRVRRASCKTETQLSTEIEVIDCDKLDVYFGSKDGIVCFSIVVTVSVISKDGDLDKVSTTAENLAYAADLAIGDGEFMDTLQNSEAPISVLLMEKAPDSSSSGAKDNDDNASLCSEDDNLDYVSPCDEDSNDDGISSSSAEENFDYADNHESSSTNTFDDFLEISYREYLQDVNRKEILAKINPPKSPSTVSDFPSRRSDPCLQETMPAFKSKRRSEPKIKFDTVVRVKYTLSRHEMTPHERFNYWNGTDDSMTSKDRNRILKMLTEEWQKGEVSRREREDDLATMPQPLPANERQGHDGYTYTISI